MTANCSFLGEPSLVFRFRSSDSKWRDTLPERARSPKVIGKRLDSRVMAQIFVDILEYWLGTPRWHDGCGRLKGVVEFLTIAGDLHGWELPSNNQ